MKIKISIGLIVLFCLFGCDKRDGISSTHLPGNFREINAGDYQKIECLGEFKQLFHDFESDQYTVDGVIFNLKSEGEIINSELNSVDESKYLTLVSTSSSQSGNKKLYKRTWKNGSNLPDSIKIREYPYEGEAKVATLVYPLHLKENSNKHKADHLLYLIITEWDKVVPLSEGRCQQLDTQPYFSWFIFDMRRHHNDRGGMEPESVHDGNGGGGRFGY